MISSIVLELITGLWVISNLVGVMSLKHLLDPHKLGHKDWWHVCAIILVISWFLLRSRSMKVLSLYLQPQRISSSVGVTIIDYPQRTTHNQTDVLRSLLRVPNACFDPTPDHQKTLTVIDLFAACYNFVTLWAAPVTSPSRPLRDAFGFASRFYKFSNNNIRLAWTDAWAQK